MRRGLRIAVLMHLVCGYALGQEHPVAYPQASQRVSQGHVAPLGHTASRAFDETRFQQLIPARFLPGTGAQIRGLEVLGTSPTTNVHYDMLRIRLSHASTPALSETFDDNVRAPQTVLDVAPGTLELKLDTWSRIHFSTPFVYDGVSDLVIEIQKDITIDARLAMDPIVGTRVGGNPGRPDLPVARYAAGPGGSGAAFTRTATRTLHTPLTLQLLVDEPTLVVRSDRGGREGNVFALGGNAAFDVHANPGTLFVLLGSGSLHAATITAPIDGLGYLPLAGSWNLGTSVIGLDGAPSTLALGIPDRADLIGFQPGFQAVLLDLSTYQLQWSCAVDFVVHD